MPLADLGRGLVLLAALLAGVGGRPGPPVVDQRGPRLGRGPRHVDVGVVVVVRPHAEVLDEQRGAPALLGRETLCVWMDSNWDCIFAAMIFSRSFRV